MGAINMREYREFPNGLNVEKLNRTYVHQAWERVRRKHPYRDPRVTTWKWLWLRLGDIVARALEWFRKPRFVASAGPDPGADDDTRDRKRMRERPWALGPWRPFDRDQEHYPEIRDEWRE